MNDEEDAVVEMESQSLAADENSAAWREVARDAIDTVRVVAWLGWSYLILRLAFDVAVAWLTRV